MTTLQSIKKQWHIGLTGLVCLLLPALSSAASVCAVVKIEIQQVVKGVVKGTEAFRTC